MIRHATALSHNQQLDADICIIGGAQLQLLELQFAGAKEKILVLESGGLALRSDSQQLAEGETSGVPYFDLQLPQRGRPHDGGGQGRYDPNPAGVAVERPAQTRAVNAGWYKDNAWMQQRIAAIAADPLSIPANLVRRALGMPKRFKVDSVEL